MENQRKLSDERVKELKEVANGIRRHRLEWNGYLLEQSSIIPELSGEAKELEEIFESLRGLNYTPDSFYTTFNNVFTTYITEHPENGPGAIEVFNKLSILLRELSLKSELIDRQCDYYGNLHNEAGQLELSEDSNINMMKSV